MKVKVWNDNDYPYTEKFREKQISIPPHDFIMMDEDEAIIFQGTFVPIRVDGDGRPLPEGYKRIRVELPQNSKILNPNANPLLCQKCRYLALSDLDLEKHTEAKHLSDLAEPEEFEKKRRGRPRKNTEDLGVARE